MMGARYDTKANLKLSVGRPLRYTETSMFKPEYTPNGKFCVVGPSPTERKWYASVVMQDGLIVKVS